MIADEISFLGFLVSIVALIIAVGSAIIVLKSERMKEEQELDKAAITRAGVVQKALETELGMASRKQEEETDDLKDRVVALENIIKGEHK